MKKQLRYLLHYAVVLGVAATAAVAVPGAAHASVSCSHVSIKSTWTLKFVSAELGNTGAFYGMLRARASTIGSWEKFYACYDDSSHQYTFKSDANGKYVEVALDAGGDLQNWLKATASSSASSTAKFTYVNPASDTPSLKSLYNGEYVSAEFGYTGGETGLLRARSLSIGPWEQFEVHVLT
jgi:hypothetical protein